MTASPCIISYWSSNECYMILLFEVRPQGNSFLRPKFSLRKRCCHKARKKMASLCDVLDDTLRCVWDSKTNDLITKMSFLFFLSPKIHEVALTCRRQGLRNSIRRSPSTTLPNHSRAQLLVQRAHPRD